MVIYTCIKNINKNYYECYKGIKEFDNTLLDDFRMISIPSSNLQFDIFKNIMDKNLLEYTLKNKIIIVE